MSHFVVEYRGKIPLCYFQIFMPNAIEDVDQANDLQQYLMDELGRQNSFVGCEECEQMQVRFGYLLTDTEGRTTDSIMAEMNELFGLVPTRNPTYIPCQGFGEFSSLIGFDIRTGTYRAHSMVQRVKQHINHAHGLSPMRDKISVKEGYLLQ